MERHPGRKEDEAVGRSTGSSLVLLSSQVAAMHAKLPIRPEERCRPHRCLTNRFRLLLFHVTLF